MNWRKNKQKHPCGSLLLARQGLRNWYQSPIGRYLAAQEAQQMDDVLKNVFGYHLLQLGCPGNGDLCPSSRIPHRMVLDREYESLEVRDTHASIVGGALEHLPIATDSIDVVLLPHTLEYVREPHQVLREVDRILIPEGHVVILGFNPLSFWLLWKLALAWRKQPPWCSRFITALRIKDWMSLLGFDVIHTGHFFHRPPIGRMNLLTRLDFLEKLGNRFWPMMGGLYIVVARKRVVTLTPIKPRWRPKRSFIPTSAVESRSRRTACEKY